MTRNQSFSRYAITFCDLKTFFQTPPMISMKDHVYQCWLCFYGPLFWLIYMMTTRLELYRRQNTISEVNDLVFSLCEDIQKKNDDQTIDNTATDFNSDDSAYSPNTSSTPITISDNNSDEDDDTNSIQSNRSFKSTLKTRFQNFKLKQQSLNEAMKRSLLRKSSKSSMSQVSSSPSSSSPSLTPTDIRSNGSKFSFSAPPTPPICISSLNDDRIRKSVHPLDRQVSYSDSLLKPINKKGKQPPIVVPPLSNRANEDHYFNCSRVSDLKGESPTLPYRRKTSPEII
ncbi:hypothetical protein [Absidia glauca]|uniref:Uncharacterized protein n=1 Tax=Absidia glauca TaxID=4829 RepID=A0A168RT18_ABSGL|nr:hypothetical protein [Absidia glauca]